MHDAELLELSSIHTPVSTSSGDDERLFFRMQFILVTCQPRTLHSQPVHEFFSCATLPPTSYINNSTQPYQQTFAKRRSLRSHHFAFEEIFRCNGRAKMMLRLLLSVLVVNVCVQGQNYYYPSSDNYYPYYYNYGYSSSPQYSQSSYQSSPQYYQSGYQSSPQYSNYAYSSYPQYSNYGYQSSPQYSSYGYSSYPQYSNYGYQSSPQYSQYQYQPVANAATTYHAASPLIGHHYSPGDISVGRPGFMLHLLCSSCFRRRRHATFSTLDNLLT